VQGKAAAAARIRQGLVMKSRVGMVEKSTLFDDSRRSAKDGAARR